MEHALAVSTHSFRRDGQGQLDLSLAHVFEQRGQWTTSSLSVSWSRDTGLAKFLVRSGASVVDEQGQHRFVFVARFGGQTAHRQFAALSRVEPFTRKMSATVGMTG